MLGSLTAGITSGSPSDEHTSGEASKSKTDDDATTDDGAKQAKADLKKDDEKNVVTTTTTTTTTTTSKSRAATCPRPATYRYGELASASLATLGATSIVSGKHKLDQQNKAAGEDGSKE